MGMGDRGDWGGCGDGVALSFERRENEGLNIDQLTGPKKVQSLAFLCG